MRFNKVVLNGPSEKTHVTVTYLASHLKYQTSDGRRGAVCSLSNERRGRFDRLRVRRMWNSHAGSEAGHSRAGP